MTHGLRRHDRAQWFVLLPFLLFALLVPLGPETPYSDDFDYAETAWYLADTGRLILSDWPSMTLAGHAAWGALFCKLGGNSYLMLRLSMFTLAALTSLALFHWARRYGHSPAFAAWCAITFALSPLTVVLQYTFLTDLTGAALATFLVLAGNRIADDWRPLPLLKFGLLAGVAYLSRQTAAIPFLVAFPMLLWKVLYWEGTWRKLLLMALPFIALVGGYQFWLMESHGVPANQQFSFLQLDQPAWHADRLLALVLGLGLHLAPMAAVLAVATGRGRRWRTFALGLAGIGFVVVCLSTSERWPILLHDDLFDLGLRAPETSPGGTPQPLRGPVWRLEGRSVSLAHAIALATATFSTLVLGMFCLAHRRPASLPSRGALPGLATLSLLATAGLLLFTPSLFDRYLFSLVPLAFLALLERIPTRVTSHPVGLGVGWGVTAVVGGLSLFGIQDGMQRSDTFWKTARHLHSLGVQPADVDAGMAYAGFFRYSPTYRGPQRIGPYLKQLAPAHFQSATARFSPLSLSANRPVCIEFEPLKDCRVVARFPFRSWFRAGELVVLVRNGVHDSSLPAPFVQWINSR
ncbi:hypothetical protein Pan44_53960 [Caulifigura coniformis]|uniref:Glycosyltransferase RgtA/B/C/D-like domain-containing protein n=1 Tax=Caulifigura coniformis TaxID=2527983 RepID=A0A517SMI8_9PLAN|nr:glycosyltransferase family 39 protein [Caulifigura coniformis]QDT57328.1 hypothetical protein Pan44_53960 [Caulifigura coniformis]